MVELREVERGTGKKLHQERVAALSSVIAISLMGPCIEDIYTHLARTGLWGNLLVLLFLLLALILLSRLPLPLLWHRRWTGLRCCTAQRAVLLFPAVLGLEM